MNTVQFQNQCMVTSNIILVLPVVYTDAWDIKTGDIILVEHYRLPHKPFRSHNTS